MYCLCMCCPPNTKRHPRPELVLIWPRAHAPCGQPRPIQSYAACIKENQLLVYSMRTWREFILKLCLIRFEFSCSLCGCQYSIHVCPSCPLCLHLLYAVYSSTTRWTNTVLNLECVHNITALINHITNTILNLLHLSSNHKSWTLFQNVVKGGITCKYI